MKRRQRIPPAGHLSLTGCLLALVLCLTTPPLFAEDWPEWRGRGRTGVWKETGIVEKFPSVKLEPIWRVPIHAGYSGPAVAGGRVFVTDFQPGQGARGIERAICLDERTGRLLWVHAWEADYAGMQHPVGPRATPTVDRDRVYILGAAGDLRVLNTENGELVWRRSYQDDFQAQLPVWGFSAAPLIDGERVILVPAGQPDAKVVALDKYTGQERWRALDATISEPGYSQPIIIQAGGARQLLVWHAGGLASLAPATGRLYWEQPFKIRMNTPIATPLRSGSDLIVSAFFNGARMYRLDPIEPKATLLWKGSSDSAVATDGLHSLMATPLIEGEYLYGICSSGQLRCLKRSTGERVWESQQATVEKKRNVSAFLIRHRGRVFIHNDRGELIIARFSPQGYEEISRAKLITPTTTSGVGRRELGAVNWAHPAFANRHVIARNDEEILSVSLAAGKTN